MGAFSILHVHSTFTLGGKEARAVRLMNAFGDRAKHTVLTSMPGAIGARDGLDSGIRADFPIDHPPLTGRPSLNRYRDLGRYMSAFDLILTYNWGAMDAVMARRISGGVPLIHHEDGFNADEVEQLKPMRNRFRRLVLPAAWRVVVPSVKLQDIALTAWKQSPDHVLRIPNGIALEKADAATGQGVIPGLDRREGEVIVGTLAGLRTIKNLPRLVRCFAAAAPANARLAIVGEGPAREEIAAEIQGCGLEGRVLMPGFLGDPLACAAAFDIFALSSDSEQFPISMIEAMAVGCPVVATDVGDVMAMVAPENRPFIVPAGDEAAFAVALARLMTDRDLRTVIGDANSRRARVTFDERQMIAAYRALYAAAIGKPAALD